MAEKISIALTVLLSTHWHVIVSSSDVRRGSTVGTNTSSSGGCERVTVPICSPIGYNETYLPNLLSQIRQDDIRLELHQFYPLIKINCSPHLTTFLCYFYLPPCTVLDEPFAPCRSLCLHAKIGCEPIMNRFGFVWPQNLDCSQFPEGGLCIGLPTAAEEIATPTPSQDIPTPPQVLPRGSTTQATASVDARCSNEPPTSRSLSEGAPTCPSGHYSLTMWYYNSVSRRCHHFVYRGCRGDNVTRCYDEDDSDSTWFCTIHDCMRSCRRRSGTNRLRTTSFPRATQRGRRLTTTAVPRVCMHQTRRPVRHRLTSTIEASRHSYVARRQD